jgi:hypothetical protein
VGNRRIVVLVKRFIEELICCSRLKMHDYLLLVLFQFSKVRLFLLLPVNLIEIKAAKKPLKIMQ